MKNRKGEFVPLSKKQWQPKPSLYKAGAAFLVEYLRMRDEYSTDVEAQAALKSETFVRKCQLYDKSTGKYLGEGTGAYKVGNKGMDANAAIKMADKNALTAAVMNTRALADLFTQDIEDKEVTEMVGTDDNTQKSLSEWIGTLFPDDHPLKKHTATKGEIAALRAMLKIWNPELKGAEETMAWIKVNCEIKALEKNGQPFGIEFIRRSQ